MRELKDCKQFEMLINGEWQRVHWEQLDEGDIVRELSPDGTVIPNSAVGNPYVISELPHLTVDKLGETRLVEKEFYCLFQDDSLIYTTAIIKTANELPKIISERAILIVTLSSILKDRVGVSKGTHVSVETLVSWLEDTNKYPLEFFAQFKAEIDHVDQQDHG